MVKFAADDATAPPADDAARRAARGAHMVYFEDGDQGPALRALTPWLSWVDDNGLLSLPFEEMADFTLRFARLPIDAAAARSQHFASHQITASPLNRIWQLALPGLGLATVSPAAATLLSRRQLRARVSEQLSTLDADDSDTT